MSVCQSQGKKNYNSIVTNQPYIPQKKVVDMDGKEIVSNLANLDIKEVNHIETDKEVGDLEIIKVIPNETTSMDEKRDSFPNKSLSQEVMTDLKVLDKDEREFVSFGAFRVCENEDKISQNDDKDVNLPKLNISKKKKELTKAKVRTIQKILNLKRLRWMKTIVNMS